MDAPATVDLSRQLDYAHELQQRGMPPSLIRRALEQFDRDTAHVCAVVDLLRRDAANLGQRIGARHG